MASLSPEREAELERGREFQRRLWRGGEKSGHPYSEARKVWGMVQLEMKFYCADFMRGQSIAVHAKKWVETRNPYHVDSAVHLCASGGFHPPPALAALVAEVAALRLAGEARSGTAAQIKREAAKGHALTLMAKLVAVGLPVEQASVKAAGQLLHPHFSVRYKASSLEKYYTAQWRELEADFRDYFATDEGAPALAQWLELIPQLPDAPDDLKGECR